jgi:hypothetical protein
MRDKNSPNPNWHLRVEVADRIDELRQLSAIECKNELDSDLDEQAIYLIDVYERVRTNFFLSNQGNDLNRALAVAEKIAFDTNENKAYVFEVKAMVEVTSVKEGFKYRKL